MGGIYALINMAITSNGELCGRAGGWGDTTINHINVGHRFNVHKPSMRVSMRSWLGSGKWKRVQ